MILWKVEQSSGNLVHVYPVGEGQNHVTNIRCFCEPRLEVLLRDGKPAGIIRIHEVKTK